MPEVRSNNFPWLDLLTKLTSIAAAVYFFSFVSVDPDLWGHIKFGNDLWHAKQLIRVDPYSFTASGQPWMNHEWLAELIFYGIYRYFGDAGLLFGKLGIGICIVILLSKLCRFRSQVPLVYLVVMMSALSIISPGFMIRPQVFSFFFFTLFVYVIFLYFEKKYKVLFYLPCLMAIWVNLHGGFLMGWVFLGMVTAWVTITYFLSKSTGRHPRAIWTWFLITSMAILLNPYGYKLTVFLYNSLSAPREISEWNPVSLFDLSYLNFKFLAVLFFIVILVNRSQSNGWEIAGIGMTLFAAFRHQRHMPFFGIMVVPYVVFGASTIIQNLRTKFPKRILSPTAKWIFAIFLGFLTAYLVYQGAVRYVAGGFRIIVDPSAYPVNAVRFIKQNNINGNLLLNFDWGEYATWKLYPGCKVSIDGRFRTVYPEPVIHDHFYAQADEKRWKTLTNKYPSDILLVPQTPFFQKLIQKQADWIYVYSDATAIVFLRDNVKNRSVLERFESGKFNYALSAPSVYFP